MDSHGDLRNERSPSETSLHEEGADVSTPGRTNRRRRRHLRLATSGVV
jgi:hypothetical protein